MGFRGEHRIDTSPMFAKVVVGDTILAAHRPGANGDQLVQDCLTALQGTEGDKLTLAMMAEYGGNTDAAEIVGTVAVFDARIMSTSHNISSNTLKQAMINQLQHYLSLPESERVDFRSKLIAKEESRQSKSKRFGRL